MISLALSLLVSAPLSVDVQVAEPVTTTNSFELAIARGALAVQNAKTVTQANGDVLYFVTNATGRDSDLDLANGPIAHLRTRDLPRGYAIVLTPRAKVTLEARGGVIVARAIEVQAVAAPVVADEPKAELRETKAESREPTAENREAKTDSREPIADGRQPMAENRLAKAETRGFAGAQPINDTNTSPLRNFGILAALLAAGGVAVIYGKKRKTPHRETAGIDLIAVKSLGGKQRLAIVDACGDRLLIATSDQGVQLLSKLEGGTGVHKIPADFMQTLAQAESVGPVPTTHVTQVNTSKDLAGLVQLRTRRATSFSVVRPLQ